MRTAIEIGNIKLAIEQNHIISIRITQIRHLVVLSYD